MKPWYTSKTLWLNLIAGIALLLQARYGFVIDPEAQTGLLAFINIILRLVTKQQIDWKTPPSVAPESGFIRLPVMLALLLILSLLMLFGCAAPGPINPETGSPVQVAGKSLLAVKASIQTAATTVDGLCNRKQLTPDKCLQAKQIYESSKPAYDTTVDAYMLLSSQGGDPAAFRAALIRLQDFADHLVLISGGAQ